MNHPTAPDRTGEPGPARSLARLAGELHRAETPDEVMALTAERATVLIGGCDAASITLAEGDRAWTSAASDGLARRGDEAQYAAGEGPCFDALDVPDGEPVRLVSDDWGQWPQLSYWWTDAGAVVSCRLVHLPDAGRRRASLNLYAVDPDAFAPDASDLAWALAAHASVALSVAHERDASRRLEDGLHTALLGRDIIGQAKGILMARQGVSSDEAFDILRRASQRLNLKLRDVAGDLVARVHDGNDSDGDQLL